MILLTRISVTIERIDDLMNDLMDVPVGTKEKVDQSSRQGSRF